MWGMTIVAVIISIGRFLSKFLTCKRLHWDDFLHFLALLALIGFSCCYSEQKSINNAIQKSQAHHSENKQLLQKLDVANAALLWTCFWLIKFSFLVLYRRLFNYSQEFIYKKTFLWCWWVVTVITALTFLLPIIGVIFGCDALLKSSDAVLCSSGIASPLPSKPCRFMLIHTSLLPWDNAESYDIRFLQIPFSSTLASRFQLWI